MRSSFLVHSFSCVALVLGLGSGQEDGTASITADELRAHVAYLASDELEGRAPATAGGRQAARYIADQFRSAGLAAIDADGDYLQPFEARPGTAQPLETENVIGFLEGSDPTLRNEVIVIGAHYDHLGRDEASGAIFNGADDDASGTAVMLEVAQAFGRFGKRPERSLMFIAFGAEELGLVGSRFYIQNPLRPLARTRWMVNLEMMGRGDEGQLTVMRLTRLPDALLDAVGGAALEQELELVDGEDAHIRSGDQYPFHAADIPILCFYGGDQHPDYHQPTDTADKIQPEWMQAVARVVYGSVLACATGTSSDARPETVERDASGAWPQWRGPLGTGAAPQAEPPLVWSETRNVRWKTPLPGEGHSSPIVWGDRVFLTAAVPFGESRTPLPDNTHGAHDNLSARQAYRFLALAISLVDGRILWTRTLREERPHAARHVTGTFASPSPVTDGEHLIASFGSGGIFCLNLDGEILWERDLGRMQVKHAHGEGSSPALFGDFVVVTADHEGESFVTALDKRTGEERWRTVRDEPTSWASPIIVEHDGSAQVIVSGTNHLRAYTLDSGDPLWHCSVLSHNVVATPVSADGMLFAGSSYEKQALVAIRLDGATGDLTNTDRIAWYRRKRTPYVPSPLLVGGWLYFLHHYQGILSRVNMQTGAEPSRPLRIAGIRDVYASPVSAAGRIYIVDRSGETVVLGADAELAELARNKLSDHFSASPALVGSDLLLRGERFLYCLSSADSNDEDR